jgi:hypothetical protein
LPDLLSLRLPLDLLHLRFPESDSLYPRVAHTFLSRSGCTIRELKCEVYDTGSALRRQLELFRELDTLDVFLEIRIADLFDTLDAECDDDTSPPILPKVQHVTITFEGGGARGNVISYTRILDLVRRRRAHGEAAADLHSVHIVVDSCVH